jgi:hypothetical protein
MHPRKEFAEQLQRGWQLWNSPTSSFFPASHVPFGDVRLLGAGSRSFLFEAI